MTNPFKAREITFIVLFSIFFITTLALAIVLGVTKTTDRGGDAETSLLSVPFPPDPKLHGRFAKLFPSNGDGAAVSSNLGLQPIHVLVLPSGKVLLMSGSSWRNRYPTETFPQYPQPTNHRGVFIKDEYPFELAKLQEYYSIVNYNGLYDPESNSFYRIPHPIPPQDPNNASWFVPTDVFCVGHLHLPNGNPLFVGGTQYYTPQRTGTRTSSIFDWKKETQIDWDNYDWTQIPTAQFNPWVDAGLMIRGRWYPSLIPLLDGRIVVYGGYVGFDASFPDMYPFEMNSYVEFFDPDALSTPQGAWAAVNAKTIPRSPFATRLEWWPEINCSVPRECEDYKNDSFKLYPQDYLLPDGRIYMTREGDFNSLRTPQAEFMRRTRITYYMSITGNRTHPGVSFNYGPLRHGNATSSGTTFLDPEDGSKIYLLGGQAINGGTFLPGLLDASDPLTSDVSLANQYVGSRGGRQLEVFELPSPAHPLGIWSLKDENFLGTDPDADRTMHYAIILPTKQILVIGGGNYDHYGPVYYPLLLTPKYNSDGKFAGEYQRQRLSDGVGPRLYHSTAVLLPDARVLVMSGNTARATIHVNESQSMGPTASGKQPKPNLGRVELDLHFFTDSSIAKGVNQAPTENWEAEIFSPPYLFTDSQNRRPVIQDINFTSDSQPYQLGTVISGKMYFLLHSNVSYHLRLGSLPSCELSKGSLVMLKLSSSTHGWNGGQRLHSLQFQEHDSTELNQNSTIISFTTPAAEKAGIVPAYYMLFFVDCLQVPSVAQMILFDDRIDHIEAD